MPTIRVRDNASGVAPHAGAWIEISAREREEQGAGVAPHAGAWIEMLLPPPALAASFVAPHAGAWIEMGIAPVLNLALASRAPRGRVD